jgi:HlyD family secretion protein
MFIEAEYPLQLATAEYEMAILSEQRLLAAARVEALQSDEGPNAQNRLLEAKLTLMEVKARLAAAEHKLRLIKDFARAQETAELNLAIAQRQLELVRAKNELARIAREGEVALAAARAGFRMEADKLERIDREMAACKIHAPRAGTVTYPADLPSQGHDADGPIRPGVVVRSGQPILRLVDNERFTLNVPISAQVARQLVPGHPVDIRFDALPQQTFQGRIVTLGFVRKPPSSEAAARAAVRVDDPTRTLRAGMSATVDFEP